MPKTKTNQTTVADVPSGDDSRPAAKRQSVGSPASNPTSRMRQQRWQWNARLVIGTFVGLLVLVVLASGSYFYHSQQTADVFLQRAELAADAENYSEQAKWLRRYSLLKPDDVDAVVNAAIAADQAADRTTLTQRNAAVDNARKQLSTALARLSAKEDHLRAKDLRSRLIERLLQLGSYWSREAERQVVVLDADHDDPQATKWMARALVGQVNSDNYLESRTAGYEQQQDDDDHERQQDYWNWLARQAVGDVLVLAVERNHNDLDLIASLLSLIESHPEFCMSGETFDEQQKSLEETKQKLAAAIDGIRDNRDSRSQLLVYQLDRSQGRDRDAEAGLLDAAKQAAQRLELQANRPASIGDPPESPSQIPASTWDYFLVLEAAKVATQQDSVADRALAAEWLEQLMSLQLDAVPPAAAENVFVTAGAIQEQLGNLDQAIEIWERGLTQVNANSLLLLWPLGNAYIQRGSDEQAADAIQRFGQAIEVAKTHWLRATVNEASRAERVALGRQLDVAAWRLSALQAFTNIRQGQRTAAINGLTKALYGSADLPIEADERLKVANVLAELCKSEGLWDKAAEAYDRAIEIAPGEPALRVASAEAWTRSGNRLQAMEQWRIAGNSDSWALQLQSTNAQFDYQLRLPPGKRDFSGVRASIDRIRRNLPSAAEITDENLRREVTFAERRLEVLAISIPPPGVSAEAHLRSAVMADGVAKLAAEHPEDETIQAFAAERLAAAGKVELANQALAQVATMLGPSSTLTILQARIEAEQHGPLAASRLLMEQLEIDDERAGDVLWLAAAYAMKANAPELAYQALSEIPEDQQSVTVLFTITNVAQSIPPNSELLSEGNKRLSPSELSLRWEQRLREREGDSGAYWKYLKATRIIDRLYGESRTFADDDPAIEEARILVRDILSLRPRWGEAISLQGWLSALQGQPEKAVEQLRRGIASGDVRLQTRQQLVEQLYRLERYAEVEQEISAAAMATEVTIDKYATTRIGLMQLQGDYERSLRVAEAAVEQRIDDFVSHLVLSKTASKVATQTQDQSRAAELVTQARAALDKASELAGPNEPRIFAAHLQLEIAHGDEQSVRAEIAKIQDSDLETYSKLMLESQALASLKDYEAAVPLLQQADKLKPSRQTRLGLAELYRRLQRHDDEVKLLREAYQSSPSNEGLRNNLAQALVARDGNNVDWDELADLLSSAKEVTPNNRLLHALLLGSRGSSQQQDEAEGILRELIEEQNQSSDDARRSLAVLLRKQLNALDTSSASTASDAVREKTFAEIQTLYDSLTLRPTPAAFDVFRYANFLLDSGEREHLPRVGTLLGNLKKQHAGSLPALELSLRYAVASEKVETVPDLVRNWMASAVNSNKKEEANLANIAGSALLNLGFFDAAAQWLEQAYRENPMALASYVFALNKAGQFKQSIDICVAHFEEHQDVVSATLLVESLLNDGHSALSPQHQMLILQALDRFGNHAPLLESVATMHHQRNELQEAIALYEKARNLAPDRIRTLNNLAMAYSEMPGQASKGIALIEHAIELQSQDPELYDTMGVLLLKTDQPAKAQVAFESAIARSPEPCYQFHLIVALLAQHQDELAQAKWDSLDLEKLDPRRLTQAEREQLTSMKAKFDEHPTDAAPSRKPSNE